MEFIKYENIKNVTKIKSYHLSLYYLNILGECSLTSTIVDNPQLVIPGSATSTIPWNEGWIRQSKNFSNTVSLINRDNDGKNFRELSFNLDQGIDANRNLKGNMDLKSLLLIYK